jgi:molecular chaperone GrpE
MQSNCPISGIGNIIDNCTFANNFEIMAEKDMQEQQESMDNNVDMGINADENIAGTSHLNDPVANESEADKIKAELEEAKDKHLRLAAEFDNFRRRTAKERLELIQTAGKDIITDLLDVIDDIERAEKQLDAATDVEQLKQGVALVFNKFKNVLASKGLKPMDVVGKDFDADLHEAITEIPAATEEAKGKVADQITKGYYLNDKIIRHAKVVVAK